MKPDSRSKVFITGINGFTGIHLSKHLEAQGFDVYGTVVDETEHPKHFQCDITKKEQVDAVMAEVAPDYVVHTAAISFVAESNASLIYDVNVIGTENILRSLIDNKVKPRKVIIAGSATVYGNQGKEVLDESMCPRPVNHYGCSKLAMEYMASNYFDRLNIIITRPFNYTGPGQAAHFLIPKIVEHYRQGKKEIELGNLDVAREFNDVRDVCRIYEQLMLSDKHSEVVNLCTGRAIPLMDVIGLMNRIAGYEIDVAVNPAFVRENEIRTLKGSTMHLKKLIAYVPEYTIEDTLRAMFECE